MCADWCTSVHNPDASLLSLGQGLSQSGRVQDLPVDAAGLPGQTDRARRADGARAAALLRVAAVSAPARLCRVRSATAQGHLPSYATSYAAPLFIGAVFASHCADRGRPAHQRNRLRISRSRLPQKSAPRRASRLPVLLSRQPRQSVCLHQQRRMTWCPAVRASPFAGPAPSLRPCCRPPQHQQRQPRLLPS